MAIEFRCPSCGKLLRVNDEAAGRQAQCPQCGSQSPVPAAAAASPFPAGSPFVPSAPAPSVGADPLNPFQSPAEASGPVLMEVGAAYQYALGRVAGPAIALIVTGALGAVGNVIGILGNLLQVGVVHGGGGNFHGDPAAAMFGGAVGIVGGILGLIMGGLVIAGAVKMKNLSSYGLAMTAAIVSVIPCISPCCVLGLPFGIWALVVLNDENVKAAFHR